VADKRSGFQFLTSSTCFMTGSGLLYSALLTGKTGSASMAVYNSATSVAVALSSRLCVLLKGAPTGIVPFDPGALPVQVDGLFVSMSAGAYGTICYSERN